MEKLDSNCIKEKQYLFNCSQCHKMIDLSGIVYFCNNCKSNYCDVCLKAHNEIFFDHEIHQTKEDLSQEEPDKSSLLANPDLDLDDRCFSDNSLPHVEQTQNDKNFSDLILLFNQTITSIQENFNEEICRLKVENKQNQENIKNNENKINESNINIDIEDLKLLPPMDRLKAIMNIVSKNNK